MVRQLSFHSLCPYVHYSLIHCHRSGRRESTHRAPGVVGLYRGAKPFIAQVSYLDVKHYSNQKFMFQVFNLSPVPKAPQASKVHQKRGEGGERVQVEKARGGKEEHEGGGRSRGTQVPVASSADF